MVYVLGVDVGGTFTDFVAYNSETKNVEVWKDFSTRGDPAEGILKGLEQFADKERIAAVRLGTTIATNTVLERDGAKIAFVTTRGFGDVPFIQRGNRRFHYNSRWIKPEPLVSREQCYEITERIDCDGNIITPIEEGDLKAVVQNIRDDSDVEAIAISFLFSYLNPVHEIRARDFFMKACPELPISTSFEVLPKWKEYERASTTIADAYVKPTVANQLSKLEQRLAHAVPNATLVVTKSNGGQTSVQGACAAPVQITLSGPTGGVVAAQFIGDLTESANFITVDMGGTSTDCALCVDGKASITTDFEIEWGVPIQIPMVDVRTVGAGGGSIAWIDKGGLLRIGPQSAGARPGPVCYGRGGTQPTVTDANLVLGRINPDNFLGGSVRLDHEGAYRAIARLSGSLRMSVEETALAIITIVNNHMVGAIRTVLIEKGQDPLKFGLMCFGGAGPVHAGDLMIQMAGCDAIVPVHPGQFSAFGFTATDARVDRQRTIQMTSKHMNLEKATKALRELETACFDQLQSQGGDGYANVQRNIEMRYHGQNYELSIPFPVSEFTATSVADLWAAFHDAHQMRFGFNIPGEVIELVNLEVIAVRRLPKPTLPKVALSKNLPKPLGQRRVRFPQGWRDTPVYQRECIGAGLTIHGPAIVEEAVTATLLHPGHRLTVDAYGNLLLAVESGDER